MAEGTWELVTVAASVRGDLFAVVAERRVPTRLRLADGSVRTDLQLDATVLLRASFVERRFLGANLLEGYEFQIALVDTLVGAPVLIVASRDEALEGRDFATGGQIWRSADLKSAWWVKAGRQGRLVGAHFRTGSKLVSADTGRYRFSLQGEVTLLPDADYVVGLRGSSPTGSTELYRIADGQKLFGCTGTPTTDAAVNESVVVVAGHGLLGLDHAGDRIWSCEPETYFRSVVGTPEGFRAYAASRIVELSAAGKVLRSVDIAPANDTILGSELGVSKRGAIVQLYDGAEVWNFAEALAVSGERAVHASRTTDTAPSVPSANRVRHARFGTGTILHRADGKARVKFDDQTERTLAMEFLSPIET